MDQAVHEVPRFPVVVAQQNSVAGLAFDQRGHIGFAMSPLKDHQIAFSVAKLAAVVDLGRPVVDACFYGKKHDCGACGHGAASAYGAARAGDAPTELTDLRRSRHADRSSHGRACMGLQFRS